MKMNVKIVIAFLVVGLIAKGHAHQCYVCDDCADGNSLPEKYLISCSGEETTTSTTVQTIEPPIETIPPGSPSTDSPTSAIPSSTTEPPTQPTTDTVTETTTEATTEATTEEQSTQETSSVSTTQSTTVQSPSLSTVTVPESPITTTSAIPVTENTATPTEITTATIPSVPPTTTGQPIGSPPPSDAPLLRQTLVEQTVYNCYVLVNATHHVNRGCVAASRNPNDMCRLANGQVLPLECRVCETDKCNSSSRMVLSVFLLVFSIGTILSL